MSEKLRVAIVGMSMRATWWVLYSIHKFPQVEVVALCDPLIERCTWAAKKYKLGDIPCYKSATEMLAQTKCDAVMVMTSDAHHAEIVVPALQAGKMVFCEKPLETTAEKCRAIIAADDKAGGKTFVGFNLRYAPAYTIIKEQIEAGAVGRILTIQADEYYDGGRTYFRRWNRFRKESGGLWITKASHDFDIITWLAGEKPLTLQAYAAKSYYVPKPEAGQRCSACKISATCPDVVRPIFIDPDYDAFVKLRENAGGEPGDLCLYNSGSDTFDHGQVSIRYTNDVFATYTCNVVAGFSDRRIRVSGTKGTLDASLTAGKVILIKRDSDLQLEFKPKADITAGHGGADDFVLSSFFDFALGKAEPKCRPREAAKAISLGLAANLSGDEGRLVEVEEITS